MARVRLLPSKKSKRIQIIFSLSLLIILGIFAGLYFETKNFVNSTKSITISQQRQQSPKDEVLIMSKAREESSARWSVTIGSTDENGEQVPINYEAEIYDSILTNNTEYQIQAYRVRVNASREMYLNNCWNGYVEIHQDVKGANRVQTVDFKSLAVDELTIDYIFDGIIFMIPLYEGDYFYYYPSAESGEVPLRAGKKGEQGGSATVGFILYHLQDQTVYGDLMTEVELEYSLTKVISDNPLFWILLVALIVWASMVVTSIVYNLRMMRLEEENARDRETIEQTMNAFVSFIDAKDPNTSGHSLRVAQYSMAIARQMGYSSEESTRIYYIGLMHDCGKISVPDSVLMKNGRLTDEEYAIVKQHTVKGAEILSNFTAIKGIRDGVLYHHERYDGSGYPEGLAGTDIPEVARIICVADSFDSMNSERCYRSKLSRSQILDELVVNKGKQFDPKIVEIFLTLVQNGTVRIDKD